MNQITDTASFSLLAGEAGFDPIEERLRASVRATIEAVFEEELASFLDRLRYVRGDGPATGYRHGHRERRLTGTFGTETVCVPRARVADETGKAVEGAAPLPAVDEEGRGSDCGGLSRRHQHASHQTGAVRAMRGSRQQGRGQPRLAQGEGGLGRLVCPQSGR